MRKLLVYLRQHHCFAWLQWSISNYWFKKKCEAKLKNVKKSQNLHECFTKIINTFHQKVAKIASKFVTAPKNLDISPAYEKWNKKISCKIYVD